MQLKASIRNIAKEKEISPQIVLNEYAAERFLERVSVSKYKNNYIVKGEFLIACLMAMDLRTTMDLDATIKNYPVSMEQTVEMIRDIAKINVGDEINMDYVGIKKIREGDDYLGYRVTLEAQIGSMKVPFKLDITTGDKITPIEIEFSLTPLMGGNPINMMAYNLSTILAEKLETIVARGLFNTRMRDYYDIYILGKLRGNEIDWHELKVALEATCSKRKTLHLLKFFREEIESIKQDEIMNRQWISYCHTVKIKLNPDFTEVCKTIMDILDHINL